MQGPGTNSRCALRTGTMYTLRITGLWKSLISQDDFDNESKSLPTTSLHHDATLAKRRANAIVKYASSRLKTREEAREQRKK